MGQNELNTQYDKILKNPIFSSFNSDDPVSQTPLGGKRPILTHIIDSVFHRINNSSRKRLKITNFQFTIGDETILPHSVFYVYMHEERSGEKRIRALRFR